MNEQQQLVRDFHIKFGHTVNDTPTLSPQDDALRVALIREELNELKAGIAKNDRVEIADALADLAYVIYGAGVTYGIDINPGHYACMTRVLVEDAEFYLSDFQHDHRQANLDFDGESLGSILGCVKFIAQNFDIPLDACFREVHESNMSKAWTEAEICDRSRGVAFEIQAGGIRWVDGWTAVSIEDGEREWVVKDAAQKAQKSPSYHPADIAGVLARHAAVTA